jgi:hypothetical protein
MSDPPLVAARTHRVESTPRAARRVSVRSNRQAMGPVPGTWMTVSAHRATVTEPVEPCVAEVMDVPLFASA